MTESDFSDAPLSVVHVHAIIDANGPITRKEIVDRASTSEATVDRALAHLRECDEVRRLPGQDGRMRPYVLDDSPSN